MKMLNTEQTMEKARRIISEHLNVDIDRVKPDAGIIDDLGADSLDTIELIMAFEEEFAVEIPDQEAEKCVTVQDVVSLLGRL